MGKDMMTMCNDAVMELLIPSAVRKGLATPSMRLLLFISISLRAVAVAKILID